MQACIKVSLPPTAKAIFMLLAFRADDETGECWPSIDSMSVDTGFSKRAVIDAIKALETVKILTANRANGRHTTYKIEPENLVKPVQHVHRCSTRTGAANDKTSAGGAPVYPQPVQMAPKPVQEVHTNSKEHINTLINKEGKKPTEARKPKPETTLKAWLANLQAAGQVAFDDSSPIYSHAEKIRAPDWVVSLAWFNLKRQYLDSPKKYIDWPKVLRNAIDGQWGDLWYVHDGEYKLTSKGKQAQIQMQSEEVLA